MDAHLFTAEVPTLIPLHNKMKTVVKAMTASTLVRMRKASSALHGGSLAFADFQFTPPFGNNILSR